MDPATIALIMQVAPQILKFFTGDQGGFNPEYQEALSNLSKALKGQGAGGGFGEAADYYRDLLSNDSKSFDAFAAPEMRRFNEEIIPGLSEQFAGMGSGALSSSGFRNAAVNAGQSLSERLGALRAGLRGQGAQGLTGLGNQLINSGVYRTAQPGFLQNVGQGLGEGLGKGAGSLAESWMKNKFGSPQITPT